MNISIPSLIIITASIGSGKSHLLRYIIHKIKDKLDYGIAFSHTNFDAENLEYIPKKFIHNNYDPEIIKKLLKIQAAQPEKTRKTAFVILDDFLFDKWPTCKVFNQLITELRHFKVFVVINTQYINKVPPLIRENALNVAMFKSDTERSLTALFESYGQSFENKNEFKKYLLTKTGDHKFIWYTRTANNMKDRYKIMEAPAKIPKFMLKCK
jgi:AAA+ ATPase superfamily predicted ATPase